MGALMSHRVYLRSFLCVWVLLFNFCWYIVVLIEPAKAMRASVSSNRRVFCFLGVA